MKLRVSRIGLLLISRSLWHSRKLASPIIYSSPTDREKALKPPAYHRLVQIAPDGRKTLYLAAHAKRIIGHSFEDSQKLIWRLINHCTQDKVRSPGVSTYDHVKLTQT
jgi:alpha-ketoglutarate-dependent 2,4-dichlorophenoxyacetate dioxygenase